MNRMVGCVALVGLIGLLGCSGDSPSKTPVPTPSTTTWQVTALVSSNASPEVNEVIQVTASISRDGSPAPDGTTVEFVSSGGVFNSGTASSGVNPTEAQATTVGGLAGVLFTASVEGTYVIQARVMDGLRQVSVLYEQPDTPDVMQAFNITPNQGPLAGGQQAIITGRNIRTPVDVYFVVGGAEFHAVTQNVDSSGTYVQILTPIITGLDEAREWSADVRVESYVGIATEVDTLPGIYRFNPAVQDPVIYALQPNSGSARGGDTVNVIGQNFLPPVRVVLGGREAGEEVVDPGGQLISILTPQYSAQPLTEDAQVDVVVYSESGTDREKQATLAGGFIFEADTPTPVITGVTPSAGPVDGGTVVTILGRGFDPPIQVRFGVREAAITSVTANQIVCVTPDYSTVPDLTPPTVVDVSVTNLGSGFVGSATAAYTYGESLFISGNQPTEGRRGALVTLYGSGFEDPLLVDYLGTSPPLRLEVVAVSGTEVVVRFPDDAIPACLSVIGAFQMTLVESGLIAQGGSFLYLSEQPEIISVAPPIVSSIGGGNGVDPSAAEIRGRYFASTVLVTINDYVLPQSSINVVDDTLIQINQLPSINDFGLEFDTIACITGGGLDGFREVPTAVSVTVTNLISGCTDTIGSGLVYEPETSDCTVAPDIAVSPILVSFADTAAGTCSPAVPVTISNFGQGTLSVNDIFLQGRFYFDAAATSQAAPGFDVAPLGAAGFDLYFCPDVDNGALYTGLMVINSNDPDEDPLQISLRGTELAVEEIVTAPVASGGTWSFPGQTAAGACSATALLSVRNDGQGNLTSISASASAPFTVSVPPATTLLPGGSTNIGVQFCPTVNDGSLQAGTLTINSSDVANSPVIIGLQAQEQP